jgi:alpha-D-ribose 1-methylphosphonate 5-triphosphate diphosphatase
MTTTPPKPAPPTAPRRPVCEFPVAEAVAVPPPAPRRRRRHGEPQRASRGKSHLGWASAARLAEAGLCTILSSDYFYPACCAPPTSSPAAACWTPAAWALISTNPAAATGLTDRGTIAPGKRADLVLIDPSGPTPSLVATIAAGRLAHLFAAAHNRLG